MIYTDSTFKTPASLDSYPTIKAHLDSFLPIFTSDNRPYGLHRARNPHYFVGEKIVCQRKCADRPVFSYSNGDCYVTQTYNIIKTNRINLKYLTGLLNSKLIEFWLKNRGKMQGTNYQIDKEPIQQIPIILPSSNFEKKIVETIDNIILSCDSDYSLLEQKIDHIVYHLYELNYDDVLIIDPETPITREGYDNFTIE